MQGSLLKTLMICAILAIGAFFLFSSGLLPASVYPSVYQATDNLPFMPQASKPYLEKYEGHWTLTFMPTTPTSTYGDCPAFTAVASVHDGQLSAHASIPGYLLALGGTMAINGSVAGQFSGGNEYSGSWSGTVNGMQGSGNWSDNLECNGTWTLAKSAASIDPVQATVASITGQVELVRGGNTNDLLPQERLYLGDQIQVPSSGAARILLGANQTIVDLSAGTMYSVPNVGGNVEAVQ